MPSSKTKKTTSKAKQSAADKKLRRFRGVVMPYAGHKSIRAVRRAGHEPSIHGTKLWKSSCLIIDYLKKHPPKRRKRVLDAGSVSYTHLTLPTN